jgi:hypothetical protein
MKKLIITTIVLLAAAAYITVMYFRDLSPPGMRTSEVMGTIPGNAALIFEFNNEKGFYDIFNDNTLLTSVIGKDKLADIDTLRSQVLQNPLLTKYFNGQNLFISLHPLKNNNTDLLFTISAAKGFKVSVINKLEKQQGTGLIVTTIKVDGKPAYCIYIKVLKKRFFIINKEDNIFSGSFSEELAGQSIQYKANNDDKAFVLLSDQQNTNSLADVYVNYAQLSPLFEQLFQNRNTDIFKSVRLLPALAVLSLNYKSDAFMFNGITTIQANAPLSYLNLFAGQQPVNNQLKNIFPATTAYSTNFSVSDPAKFTADLAQWYSKAKMGDQKDTLFKKIKAETGVNLRSEFDALLGNEFAIVTTRYEEKFAIISVKDGSKLKPVLMNISHMNNDNIGQFNYDKIPFFLLGDAFNALKRPYFMIVDNYLVLANSAAELNSYNDIYFNRKFLSKMDNYNSFDDLVAERSNVSFFINFKNVQPVFKRDMAPAMYQAFENLDPGWKNFYAASYQLSASDKNFYTNFCMRLNNTDSTYMAK